MKRIVILLITIVTLNTFTYSQDIYPAQGELIMSPDTIHIFDKTNGPKWCNTTFYNYQGILLMFSSSHFENINKTDQSRCWNSRLYIYKQILNNGKYCFELLNVGNMEYIEFDKDLNGAPVPFEFQNHLWLSASRYLVKLPDNFLDQSDAENIVFFKENTLVVDDDFVYSVIPQGDTLLNLFTIHEFSEMARTLHHKKAYLNNSGEFVVNIYNKINLHEYSSDGGKIQDIIPFNDGYLINSLFENGNSYTCIVSYYNSKSKIVKLITSVPDCFESTLIKGSIEGKRSNIEGKEWNERYTLFTISKIKNDGLNPINYYEYYNNGDVLKLLDKNILNLSASIAPSKIYSHDGIGKEFFLKSMFSYVPWYDTSSSDLNNFPGLQQQISLFYPYTNNSSFANLVFYSDVWRTDKNSFISNDMNDTTKYGQNIKGLWQLVGILDGAPPCSIDWSAWENNNQEYATELTFDAENKTTTSLSIEQKDTFTTGLELSFGNEDEGKHAKITTKYSHAWANISESEKVTDTKISQTFQLKEGTQNQAYYLWSVPNIMRATYQIYPYWGAYSLEYPLDSTQHFMFRVLGQSLHQEAVDISNYPFLIDNPNDSLMDDWHLVNRDGIYNAQFNQGVFIGNISMPDNGNPGGSLEFYEEQTETNKISVSNEVEIEVEAGYTIPEVFSVNISVGNSFEWLKEYTISTAFGTGLEASLKELNHNLDGLKIESLSLNVYYFEPRKDNEGWWFYDSVPDNQYPWYIAYAIPSSDAKISLLEPHNGLPLKSSDILFSWKNENEVVSNYKLYISKSPFFSNNNIVINENVGQTTSYNLNVNRLKPATKYYWRVSGIVSGGEKVVSETKTLKIADVNYLYNNGSRINAIIYPNPISQNILNIAFSSSEEGKFSIKIMNLKGNLLYNSELFSESDLVSNLQVDISDFQSGIYMVIIQSGKSIYNNKLVVFH